MDSVITVSTRSSAKLSLTKVLLICGIASSTLYVAMCIIVPMQYPGYNSASQTISELSAIDAPTRPLWVIPGFVYTLLVAAFGWGINKSAGDNLKLFIAGIVLMVYGVIGLGWAFFPMHQREVLAAGGGTISDTMHIAYSAVSVLLMLLAMGFAAAASGKRFRVYTIGTILLLLILGLLTGLDAPKLEANLSTPWVGVWERIMIGLFLVWVVVLAINRLQSIKKVTKE